MVAVLTVGQVAKRAGVSVATLHFYEEKRLIFSQRNAGNQRRYRKDVLRRVAIIKAAQQMGLTLREIKAQFAALPSGEPAGKQHWQRLSTEWQGALDARIAQLTALRDSLTGCIGCGCLSMDRCPIYNPDDEAAAEGAGAVFLRVDKGMTSSEQ